MNTEQKKASAIYDDLSARTQIGPSIRNPSEGFTGQEHIPAPVQRLTVRAEAAAHAAWR